MFLDEFDHLIKEKYHIRYYGRYMDDFYLIFRTKKEAQEMLAIIREYMDGVELELNQKTGIFPLKNGIDFLGFHTYLTEEGGVVQKLRRDSIKRIRSKIRHWREDYAAGTITKEKIIEKFVAWTPMRHTATPIPSGPICQAGQRDCRRDYKAPPENQWAGRCQDASQSPASARTLQENAQGDGRLRCLFFCPKT